MEELRDSLLHHYRAGYSEEEFVLPTSDGKLLAWLHQHLEVLSTAYDDGMVRLRVRGGAVDLARARDLLSRAEVS